MTTPMAKLAAEARLETAWREVLQTENGRMVVTDILVEVCHHLVPTSDPEKRARQQVALEILHRSGLFNARSGSFPYDYVSMLTKVKLQSPESDPPVPHRSRRVFHGLLGRIFGRKDN